MEDRQDIEDKSKIDEICGELCKTDIQTLFHELHTHQIELQSQNEDLKRIQIELENSRKKYSDLYDFAPISYFIFNKIGVIRQLNLTASKKLNNDRENLIGVPFSLFVAEDCKLVFYEHMQSVISSKQRQICELRINPKRIGEKNQKNELIDVQLESIPVQDLQNQTIPETTIRSVMTDVTELKKKEKELRRIENELLVKNQIEELKNFYETIVDTIQEGLWKIDLDGRTLYVNNQMSELLGYSIPEMLGKTIFDFVDKDHLDFLRSRLERRKQGVREKYECKFVKKNGTKIWVTVSASPIIENTDERKIIGAIGLLTDITEQKYTQNRLKESEEKYRTIVQYSNDLIWAEDKEGNFTFCNRRAEKISGYSERELLGKNFLDFIVKDDRERLKSLFDYVLQGQAIEYETKFINRFNKQITVAVNKAPIYNKGQVIGCTSFGRDITEQKEAEEKLKQFAEKLKKSNEELEQFAYIASHDLQEPLRTISSYSELISSRYKGRLDAEADEFFSYIIYGTKRLQNLILDLLELSRVGTRGKPFKPTDTNDVLDVVLKNLNELIDKSNAKIFIEKLPTITADFSQLVQLFQNLIDNAIKFSKPGITPEIHIKAEYQEEPPQWIFSVQDNGIGIDPKDFKDLFKIFHRLHSREEYEGTGIGLAISKKIVERHYGEIWIDSALGNGSTFYFSIPVLSEII